MLTCSIPKNADAAMNYFNRGNYYFENNGMWKGKLSGTFGLGNGAEVGKEFEKYLNGFQHVTNEKIVASAGAKAVVSADGTYTVLKSGHRVGYDLTFSAPKSVSLLYLEDPRIEQAFNEAVDESMNHIETNFAKTRTKHFENSVPVIEEKATGNLLWAQFNHKTSRAVDPQLHAHCVVMNMTNDAEKGECKTLNGEFYKKGFAKNAGQFFRNSLSEKLKTLGYEIEVTDRKQGLFELAGVEKNVIDQFSKRSDEIDKKVAELRVLTFKDLDDAKLKTWAIERFNSENKFAIPTDSDVESIVLKLKNSTEKVYAGFSDTQLATEANLQSRAKKTKDLTWDDVRYYVDEQLEDLGTNLKTIAQNALKMSGEIRIPLFKSASDVIDLATRDLTDMQSGFTKDDLMSHALKLGLGDFKVKDIYDSFDSKIEMGDIVLMQKRPDIYTTNTMINIEETVISYCKTGKNSSTIKVDKPKALDFIESTDLELKLKSAFNNSTEKLQSSFQSMAFCKSGEYKRVFNDDEIVKIESALKESRAEEFKKIVLAVTPEKQFMLKEFLSETGYGFTPGQKAAIELIAATGDQFSVIQGDAGTGKSFSMNYAREMLEADGYIVRGYAPTGKASVELSNSAKIKGCQTIDKFLIDGALKSPVTFEEYNAVRIETDRLIPLLKGGNENLLKRFHLTTEEVEKMQDYQIEAKMMKHDRNMKKCLTSPVKGKEVWVIDESGMAGSAKYLKVMEAARRSEAKVVFVGDRKQFASIEAGRMFVELQDKAGIDTVIMPDVFRQKTDQTKEIVKAISMKDMDFAFDMMRGRKEITEGLGDINSYQAGQLIYFRNGIENLADAGSSAKVTAVNENGTVSLGIYDELSNKYVDYHFTPAELSREIVLYEMVHGNVISEKSDRDERLQLVVDDYLTNTALQIKNNPDKLFETMIITATNKDRSRLNEDIRNSLLTSEISEMRVQGSMEFPVLESNSLGGTAKSFADSYAVGQKFVSAKMQKEVKIPEKELGVIVEIDKTTNRFIVEYPYEDELGVPVRISVDPSRDEFSTYKENIKPFGVNDKIVFLKNDKDVRNGQLAIITNITEEGDVTCDLSGETVKFNLNEYNYIDHAYCLSEYKSQGATVGRLVWHADTKAGEVSSNSFYVAITRCTHEVALYTDDAETLQEKVKDEQFKWSTLDRINRPERREFIDLSDIATPKLFDIDSSEIGSGKSFHELMTEFDTLMDMYDSSSIPQTYDGTRTGLADIDPKTGVYTSITPKVVDSSAKMDQSNVETAPAPRVIGWGKIEHHNIEYYGSQRDNMNRVYFIPDQGGNVNAAISDGKGGRVFVGSSKDIPLKELKSLVQTQFETVVKGNPVELPVVKVELPADEIVWGKIASRNVDYYGSRKDNVHRVYFIPDENGYINATVSDGKGGRAVVGSSKDIPLENLKALVQTQFETVVKGNSVELPKVESPKLKTDYGMEM